MPSLLNIRFAVLFFGLTTIGPILFSMKGSGIALHIFFVPVSFFNSFSLIVEIKLIIVLFLLNFNSPKILFPTAGVIDKIITDDLLINS